MDPAQNVLAHIFALSCFFTAASLSFFQDVVKVSDLLKNISILYGKRVKWKCWKTGCEKTCFRRQKNKGQCGYAITTPAQTREFSKEIHDCNDGTRSPKRKVDRMTRDPWESDALWEQAGAGLPKWRGTPLGGHHGRMNATWTAHGQLQGPAKL